MPRSVEAGSRLTATLAAEGLDLRTARIVWEADGEEPSLGQSRVLTATRPGPHWLEAEAQLPDGRRAFAVLEFDVRARRRSARP